MKPTAGPTFSALQVRLRAAQEHFELEYTSREEERSYGLVLREQERFTRLAALALREAAVSPPYPASTHMHLLTITRSRPIPTQGAIKLLRLGLNYPRAVAAF